jgi:putative ABC transport system substrate-binding protein
VKVAGNRWSAAYPALAVCAVLFALCFPALAQQPTKVPRIGYLGSIPFSEFAARRNGFRQALRDLGYIEGKNIFIDWRSAEGKLDRLPGLAAELVRLKVDIIVSASPTTTLSIKDATSTIPIVMAQDADPVASGFAASLAQPGGNVTGLTTLLPEISGKRLEILRETVPRLVLVAVLGASTTPGTPQSLKETELAAEAFKVQLHYVDVLEAKDVELAFQDAAKWHVDALLILGGPFLLSRRTQIADLAIKNRFPAIYYSPEFVEDGGLMSYGVNFIDLHRRAATYVDKILKGAKPADLPVEQPTKFELVINLKAAKQIGLIIPPNVLARADRVIR